MSTITDWNLQDLFKIRDALDMLDKYGLADKELLQIINTEINSRGIYGQAKEIERRGSGREAQGL